MNAFATAGLGFLLAVLWFDLMFDVQTRRHDQEVLPPEVLSSISAYYRRVTTEASPMNRLVALMMLVVLGAILAEIFADEISPLWTRGSLALIRLCCHTMRTLRRRRLGPGNDPPDTVAAARARYSAITPSALRERVDARRPTRDAAASPAAPASASGVDIEDARWPSAELQPPPGVLGDGDAASPSSFHRTRSRPQHRIARRPPPTGTRQRARPARTPRSAGR